MILKPGTFFPLVGNVSGQPGKEPVTGKNPVPVSSGNDSAQSFLKITSIQSGLEVLKTTAHVLGLPQDNLSLMLLAFTRFFSVTPDAELLSRLRKEMLNSGSSTPKTAAEKAALEAKVMAALAAADKGVVPGEALPEIPDNAFEAWNFPPGANDLRQSFENFSKNSGQKEEKNRFLELMNRIPGKNGQHWIVWPFNYRARGTELRVLIRILIKEPKNSFEEHGSEGWLIADISGPKHGWHFLLYGTGRKTRADIGIVPGLSGAEIKKLEKEIKDLGFLDIRIFNGETLPLTEILGVEALPSVNQEV